MIFFDNFLSYDLLVNLADENLKAIGTVPGTCTQGANKKLTDTKTKKNFTKGELDYCNNRKI